MILFLTGFMGSGKSRIGREISQRKGWKFIDTDSEIEKRAGMSVKKIFEVRGESFFRSLEEEVIDEISRKREDCVVALGGGALISLRSQQTVLENGFLVYIKSDPREIYQRVRHTTKRPLLQANGQNWDEKSFLLNISDLIKTRESGYQLARLTVQRDGIEAAEAADRILKFIEQSAGKRKE